MSSQWLFHHFVLYIIFIHSLLNFLLRAGTVIVRNGQECAYILFVKSVSWWSIKCVLHVIMQYGQQTRDRKVNGSDFECHVSVSVHSCRQCVSHWKCKHCKVWEVCVSQGKCRLISSYNSSDIVKTQMEAASREAQKAFPLYAAMTRQSRSSTCRPGNKRSNEF